MEHSSKPIAIVQGATGVIIQQLFRDFIAGHPPSLRIAGLIESGDCKTPADGRLLNIADGRDFALFQELGAGSVACSLDAESVIEASSRVCTDIARGCDLVVLNKFGKLEAENRSGLIPAFTAAIEAGLPILTSVSPKFSDSWASFAAPMYAILPPEMAALQAWWQSARFIDA
jgi:hypothetical protein